MRAVYLAGFHLEREMRAQLVGAFQVAEDDGNPVAKAR